MNFWENLYFNNPEALWLLILVPTSLLFLRKKLEGQRKPILLGLGMMRGLLLTLLVLAMSNPSIVSRKISGGPHYFIGYDGSASIKPEALSFWLENWRNQLSQSVIQLPEKITYFKLGKSLHTYRNLDDFLSSLEEDPVNYSRIYDGITELDSLVDDMDYPVVILLSDGNETEKQNAVYNLANREFYWGVLPVKDSRGIRIKSFDGPSRVLKGRNFKLKCLIQSSEVSDITLELIKDGVSKETRDINLNKGYSFFEFEQKSDQLGNGVFELKLN